MVNATPCQLYPRERNPAPIVQEAGWAPGPVWTAAVLYENISEHPSVTYPSYSYSKFIRKTQHRCHKPISVLDASLMQNTGLHSFKKLFKQWNDVDICLTERSTYIFTANSIANLCSQLKFHFSVCLNWPWKRSTRKLKPEHQTNMLLSVSTVPTPQLPTTRHVKDHD